MHVSLTDRLAAFVREKVESGRYNNASEVVREALRLLEEHDEIRQLKLDRLREAIFLGDRQVATGELSTRSIDDIIADNEAALQR